MLSHCVLHILRPHAAHRNTALEPLDHHKADITWLGHGIKGPTLVFKEPLPQQVIKSSCQYPQLVDRLEMKGLCYTTDVSSFHEASGTGFVQARSVGRNDEKL